MRPASHVDARVDAFGGAGCKAAFPGSGFGGVTAAAFSISARRIFASATAASPALVLLLHAPEPEHQRVYRAAGATVIEVAAMDDFPRLATDLALALFPDGAAEAL